jgi:hypothetical protein
MIRTPKKRKKKEDRLRTPATEETHNAFTSRPRPSHTIPMPRRGLNQQTVKKVRPQHQTLTEGQTNNRDRTKRKGHVETIVREVRDGRSTRPTTSNVRTQGTRSTTSKNKRREKDRKETTRRKTKKRKHKQLQRKRKRKQRQKPKPEKPQKETGGRRRPQKGTTHRHIFFIHKERRPLQLPLVIL